MEFIHKYVLINEIFIKPDKNKEQMDVFHYSKQKKNKPRKKQTNTQKRKEKDNNGSYGN